MKKPNGEEEMVFKDLHDLGTGNLKSNANLVSLLSGLFLQNIIFMDKQVLFWNFHGTGHPRFYNFVKEYRREFNIDLFCLVKTRIVVKELMRLLEVSVIKTPIELKLLVLLVVFRFYGQII